MSNEGVKYDSGKVPWDLIPWDAMEQVALVLQYGAGKYGPRNWEQGIEAPRLFAAMMRHTLAHIRGQELDEETHLPHLAHAVCNAMFMLALFLRDRKPL